MTHDGDATEAPRVRGPSKGRADGTKTDLLFDYSGVGTPDVQGLALLLTARLLAGDRHQRVWVRGLPFSTWRLLTALGLDHLFRLFPISVEPSN